jgi:cobalamin biosynthesis Mg chelatase CobN
MNSPEHRANILSTQFTQVGIATAQGTYDGKPVIYVAEEFGTPAPAPLAFVNTASAASVVATAPAVTPAKKSVTPVAPAPTVIVTQSSSDANSQQTFVAVSSGTQEGQVTPTATSVQASTVAASGNSNTKSVAQSNIIQLAFSDPKAMTDDFYFIIMIIFAAALILNIFIKIRVQYSQVIASGLLVIVVAGLFVMLNQNIGLLHAVVL